MIYIGVNLILIIEVDFKFQLWSLRHLPHTCLVDQRLTNDSVNFSNWANRNTRYFICYLRWKSMGTSPPSLLLSNEFWDPCPGCRSSMTSADLDREWNPVPPISPPHAARGPCRPR